MAEARKARVDRIFRCTPKRGEESKAVNFARWKDRHEKNIASVISLTKKFKSLFHSKPVLQSKTASKEVQKPAFHIPKSNYLPRVSLKKPPFIVPGRIRHNDLHLLQALPQVKNSLKKDALSKQSSKTPSTQSRTSKQALTKIKSTAPVFKPSSGTITDACPQCKRFTPPAGITIPEQSSLSLAQKTDYQDEISSKPPLNNFRSSFKPNPWITVDRRFSVQKSFNSLLSSRESSAPQAACFLEDDTDFDSEEEDEKESLPEIGVPPTPDKIEIALQLRAQMDEKKTHLNGLCNRWSSILEEGDTIPQDELGSILTVIGQTQQLQRERFNQYATLILQFEKNTAEKTITKSDLEGFWEMISLQVTDVENKFTQLNSLRSAGWKRQEDVDSRDRKKRNPKKTDKKKDVVESEVKSSGVRSHIAALRKKQIESLKSVKDNPVAFLDQQPLPVILLSRMDIEANGVSQSKQNDREGDKIQQADSCQKKPVILSSKLGTCTPNKDILDSTLQPNYQLRDKKKHKLTSNNEFFSSPHQPNISRLRSRTMVDRKIDQLSVPTSPDSSILNNDTPLSIKILRADRKKHNSSIGIGYFSSPHETDSPRQRSRTTECILDPISVTCSPGERTKMLAFNQVCDDFKPFSPTTEQVVTRSGRVSHSPARFGQNDTPSLHVLRSSCYQYTKPEMGNADQLSQNKEENNNDVSDGYTSSTHL